MYIHLCESMRIMSVDIVSTMSYHIGREVKVPLTNHKRQRNEGGTSTMMRQHPFQDFYSLFDSMIPDTMLPPRRSRAVDTMQSCGMPLDVYTTEDQAVVLASVPGIAPE